ncbi:hypothetical protein FGG08_004009 [Glutinoglossum americanum]|uniref:Uncharacterized protein n=1 Tax=Glutinoglossum americanum TaxID=1670608 RepID=A0A9P8I663_9PEZI|nr:hypothetical protein FGG08_004009 [Glutinoglossum americanum]
MAKTPATTGGRPSSPSPRPSSPPRPSSGLSKGNKIGLGVGLGIGLTLLLVALIWCIRIMRRSGFRFFESSAASGHPDGHGLTYWQTDQQSRGVEEPIGPSGGRPPYELNAQNPVH